MSDDGSSSVYSSRTRRDGQQPGGTAIRRSLFDRGNADGADQAAARSRADEPISSPPARPVSAPPARPVSSPPARQVSAPPSRQVSAPPARPPSRRRHTAPDDDEPRNVEQPRSAPQPRGRAATRAGAGSGSTYTTSSHAAQQRTTSTHTASLRTPSGRGSAERAPANRAVSAPPANRAVSAPPATGRTATRERSASAGTDVAAATDRSGVVQGSHRRELRLLLELRVIGMVVRRELKRYFRSRAKILSSFVQPFFFLLIFGYGMRTLVRTTGGVSFEQFVFPGVVAMTVLGRALLSAVTIVQDREFGFLREMLVSPANRVSIVIGAILGGATISTIQAVLLFLGAPLMGLFPGPGTIVTVLAVTALMAVEVTALGVALATFIQRPHSFQAVTQAITYPMLVLSGALVPLAGLPAWVGTIAKFNIFSYSVDATRRLLLGSSVSADQGPLTGLTVLGHQLSITDEVGLSVVCTGLFVMIAAWRFAKVT